MINRLDLENGTIDIAQRHWRGDIDVPKTPKSKRVNQRPGRLNSSDVYLYPPASMSKVTGAPSRFRIYSRSRLNCAGEISNMSRISRLDGGFFRRNRRSSL